jgi:uncharacterized protein YgiM (DUF1202 family)
MPYKTVAVLVGGLMANSCAGALARPAFTTFNANLRSGPGVGSAIVGVVPDQAQIEVGSCSGSWCRVNWEGAEGYLSTTLIAFGPRRAIVAPAPPTVVYRDRTEFSSGATCDPSFDARCAGYGGRYVYYNGYDAAFAGDDYGYDNSGYPYDSFGFGIFGGNRGGEYYGRRIGGQRWGAGGGTMNMAHPGSFRGPVANRNMPLRSGGGFSAGGRIAPNHVNAGRMSGAARMSAARGEMRVR